MQLSCVFEKKKTLHRLHGELHQDLRNLLAQQLRCTLVLVVQRQAQHVLSIPPSKRWAIGGDQQNYHDVHLVPCRGQTVQQLASMVTTG
jgi:hypothetical protein